MSRDDYDDTIRELMPALLAYFVRRITPPEDAADCLSETLVVLWRRRRALPSDAEDARRWAFGVAKGAVTIVAGDTARLKRLQIRGDVATLAQIAACLYEPAP